MVTGAVRGAELLSVSNRLKGQITRAFALILGINIYFDPVLRLKTNQPAVRYQRKVKSSIFETNLPKNSTFIISEVQLGSTVKLKQQL